MGDDSSVRTRTIHQTHEYIYASSSGESGHLRWRGMARGVNSEDDEPQGHTGTKSMIAENDYGK